MFARETSKAPWQARIVRGKGRDRREKKELILKLSLR